MVDIREYQEKDWPQVWLILEKVFRDGETYVFSPQISEEEAHQVWIEAPTKIYVATDKDKALVGTYVIKPNQPALGAHVCNCGYVVAEKARGQGVASAMCKHSQHVAITLGFRAMQFNFVVSTNEGAIRLWQKLGFQVVGRLPKAFNSRRFGYVDALVMFKELQA